MVSESLGRMEFKVVSRYKFTRITGDFIACKNIRFFSLFAAGEVSRGETSALQRQKFHTDDVKSVRNPVISADWKTE